MPPQIAAARPSSSARGMPSFKTAGSGARVGGPAAFKPPRPQASGAAAGAGATNKPGQQPRPQKRQQTAKGREADEPMLLDEEADELEKATASSRQKGKKRAEPEDADEQAEDDARRGDDVVVDDDEDDDDADSDVAATIPPELLTRLLHHFFSKANSRITQDANTSVGKYMEIFVREAVARSVAERRDGGFLDVDVLQKVAAQLIMDM